MSARRLRWGAAGAALGLAAGLGAFVAVSGTGAPVWTYPLFVAAVLVLCEFVSLARHTGDDVVIERAAVTAGVARRLLVVGLVSFSGAAVALLAAAVPARHGLASGLLGAAATGTLFVLLVAVARGGGEV